MTRSSNSLKSVVYSTLVTVVAVVGGLTLVAASFLQPWLLLVLAGYTGFQFYIQRRMWRGVREAWELERERDRLQGRLDALSCVGDFFGKPDQGT